MKKINELMNVARFSQDPFIAAFGMKIEPRMARIEGRVLPEPRIEYGSQQRGLQGRVKEENIHIICWTVIASSNSLFQPNIVTPKDGVWRCEGEKFYSGGSANGLGVVSFLNRDKDRMAE